MAKWQTSQNSFFFSLSENPPIPPHSVIPYHLWMKENENFNGNIAFYGHSDHFHFTSSSFVILEWWRMTEWGEMKGVFRTKAKPLILKTPLIRLHSVIPSNHHLLPGIIPFILGSFRHFNLIPVPGQWKIIPCRRYTAFAGSERKNRVLSLIETAPDSFISRSFQWSKWGLNERIGCCLYKRQHLILSFLGHSSVILTSFHGQ